MEPRHWVIAAASAVIVACVGFALFLQMKSEDANDRDESAVNELEVGEPAAPTVPRDKDGVSPDTPEPGAPDLSHGVPNFADITEDDVADADAFVDVPQEIVDTGERAARAWLTVDTDQMGEARQAQLAEVIPNADKWAKKKPKIHFFKPQASGNPSWRTVSEVLNTKTVAGFATGLDGVYTVPVEVSFTAQFSSGGGQDRGTLSTVNVWNMKFDYDGNLIGIEEPKI
ncbi:hypothetical protein EDF62_3266 [Leucobacter luti]|uniref:Uncharacterized protein n=1 Tax=Leucobacter luti TaxID=340320 RepID=A0A4R6RTD6_9MICO|nr:hypothetical protein [Leucobacter luti]TDP89535.1 hypothetical protein EDF62_3266 [Leucobacter luti]